jgi:hypothetical protein
MSNYPRSVIDAVEMLRIIEKAVVEDSLESRPDHVDINSFVDAQHHRVANAVRIFCAALLQKE